MIKFIQGNCFNKILELEDNSIDCVISSPPYFGLRDYGTSTWKGGNVNCNHTITHYNDTLKPHVNRPFRGNRDYCLHCNAERIDEQFGLENTYQDYIASTVKLFETFKSKLKDQATIWWNVGDSYHNYRPTNNKEKLYKHPAYPKQSISNTRQDLPTESLKRNQRYEEIKEKDLMMIPNRAAIALQEAGWYIRSEIVWHKPNPMPESVRDRPTSCHEKIWLITKNKKYYYDSEVIKEPCKTFDTNVRDRDTTKLNNTPGRSKMGGLKKNNYTMKNKRNVWTVTTKPLRDAHFATFPMDLIEPCVLAGCPEGGTILDPFGGAGTTGLVARKHNRNSILIELNPKYIEIAKSRITKMFGSLI